MIVINVKVVKNIVLIETKIFSMLFYQKIFQILIIFIINIIHAGTILAIITIIIQEIVAKHSDLKYVGRLLIFGWSFVVILDRMKAF